MFHAEPYLKAIRLNGKHNPIEYKTIQYKRSNATKVEIIVIVYQPKKNAENCPVRDCFQPAGVSI